MKLLIKLILLTFCLNSVAYATLTPTTVPVTKTGGSTPVLQNGSITDTGTSAGVGNVGIGSSTPGQALDVNGNGNFKGGISTSSWTDPINDWNAAGNDTQTTGTISSGTNSLSVSSATGWSVGMGIAVVGAGSASATLITSVTNISGTTFTLANNASTLATGQVVRHDDTVALNNAAQSGKNVILRQQGVYNITSTLNFTIPVTMEGANANDYSYDTTNSIANNFGSVLKYYSATGNALYIQTGFVRLKNLAILQSSSVTPTAGYAILIGTGLINTPRCRYDEIENINIQGTFSGVEVRTGTSQLFFHHNNIQNLGGGGSNGLYITNSSPAGDNFFTDSQFSNVNGGGPGIFIDDADVSAFIDVKVNGQADPDVKINDATSTVNGQRFIGCSFEGGSNTNPLVVLSSTGAGGVTNTNFTGTECGQDNGKGCFSIANFATNTLISNTTYSAITGQLINDTSTSNTSNIPLNVVAFRNNGGNTLSGDQPTLLLNLNGVSAQSVGSVSSFSMSRYAVSSTNARSQLNIGLRNNTEAVPYPTVLSLQSGGNVGIGSTMPQGGLDVEGTVNPVIFFAAIPATGTNKNVGIGTTNPGQALDVQGTIRASKLGGTLAIASGTNGCQGQGTLASGTVTISTTCTPTSSQGIFLQDSTTGSLVNVGTPTVGTVTSGTSFVINSSNALDSSNINWWILKSS